MAEIDDDVYSLPRIIFRKRWAPLRITGSEGSRHSFGGPLACAMNGWPADWLPPQRVATLDLADPALSMKTKHKTLPLVYAYRIDGCELEYGFATPDQLQLQELSGTPERDWPYPGYPDEFPVRRLSIGSDSPVHWECDDDNEECDEGHVWSVVEDDPPERDEFLLIVPPNADYGVSLWGIEGDREKVDTIFRVNVRSATVRAWNACS